MIQSVETAQLLDAVYELEAKVAREKDALENARKEYESLRSRVSALQAAAARAAGDEEDIRPATSRRRLLETDVRYQNITTTQLQRERCAADRDLTLAARALVAVKGQLSEAVSENKAVRRQLDEREGAVLQRIRGDDLETRIRALCWLVGRLEHED